MRGKIACTASKLSLLDPAMVHSVVDAPAFHIANQYRSDSRVRIVEATDRQISSVVIGNSGVYELTIQLKDGFLTTKCTCPLNEQPLCRHSIAVLLEYHRWAQPKPQPLARTAARPVAAASNGSPAALDVTLNDINTFVAWLQSAVSAIEQGKSLPDRPPLDGRSDASKWVEAVQTLDERARQLQEQRSVLESDLQAREAHVEKLTQELHACTQETQSLRGAYEKLQGAYAGLETTVHDLAKNLTGVETEAKTLADDFVSKASHLHVLLATMKETSSRLQALANKDSSRPSGS